MMPEFVLNIGVTVLPSTLSVMLVIGAPPTTICALMDVAAGTLAEPFTGTMPWNERLAGTAKPTSVPSAAMMILVHSALDGELPQRKRILSNVLLIKTVSGPFGWLASV